MGVYVFKDSFLTDFEVGIGAIHTCCTESLQFNSYLNEATLIGLPNSINLSL